VSRLRAWLAALALIPLVGVAPAQPGRAPALPYTVLYDVTIVPTERTAHVAIRLTNAVKRVVALHFRVDEAHFDFRGDGEVTRSEGELVWRPPPTEAVLRYKFRIDHLRDERSYDARCTERWAIFRGDDLVPPARVRAEVGSTSRSRLRLRLPEGWSAVTPYPPGSGGTSRIEHPERRFDRPTGWFVLGDIAALHEDIAGTHVAIAGPKGHQVRRHDLLAMMRWHLPTLNQLLGEPLPRFLIASARDPMWRGGLSASSSVFLHADRPLISEDGTSPLLHELMHAALRVQSRHGADWIVEGLAELYSLELLRRAGTFDEARFRGALERLARRGGSVPERGSTSTGSTSARAATVLHALDREIRERTGEAKSLDHVVRALVGRRSSITTEDFRQLAEQVTGLDLGRFFRRHLRR
jgi:hypothetical protein